MIVSSKALFKKAYGKYAVGAYNINNLEQLMGVVLGALKSRAPFIIQVTRGAWEYTDRDVLMAAIKAVEKKYPRLEFAVHLDHGDLKACLEAVKMGGFSSVMIDASHKSFAENLKLTKKVVAAAHKKGIAVEAELGQLGGVEEDIKASVKLTDPEQAKEFVKRSGIDSLACAIGTSHGAYKFAGKPKLHFEIIKEIKNLLPNFPLVMHGSSAVPVSEIRRINAAGGRMPIGHGVPEADYLKAAKLGVCKINIDTDGRLIWCRVHREFFKKYPGEFDLRKPGKIFMLEFANYVARKNKVLGSAGKL